VKRGAVMLIAFIGVAPPTRALLMDARRSRRHPPRSVRSMHPRRGLLALFASARTSEASWLDRSAGVRAAVGGGNTRIMVARTRVVHCPGLKAPFTSADT